MCDVAFERMLPAEPDAVVALHDNEGRRPSSFTAVYGYGPGRHLLELGVVCVV